MNPQVEFQDVMENPDDTITMVIITRFENEIKDLKRMMCWIHQIWLNLTKFTH